jgi:hypothetical protein
MASPDMSIKLYIFPVTEKESAQPNLLGYKLIMENPDRCIEAPDLGYGDFCLNNYDMGRNLIVYENKVYEIFKDYSDITNKKRYFLLRPVLRGSDQMQ